MKTLLGFMFLTFVSAAVAGERGNGGDVVVCRNDDGTIISVELLDYYEGRVMRKLPVIEYSDLPDEEFFEKIGKKINSMEDYFVGFSGYNSKMLMENIREYRQTGNWSSPEVLFTEEDLTDIPDSDELIIKRGCKVEQIAIWLKKTYPEDPQFIIHAGLISHLSERDLRGLVIHEILYMALADRNSERGCRMNNSVPVRYYHQKLLSRPFEMFTFKDHLNFVETTCGDEAFIKREQLELKVIYDGQDNQDGSMKVMVFNSHQLPFKPIGLVLAINKEGKLNHELSLKYGSFAIKPYGVPEGYGIKTPGTFGYFNSVLNDWHQMVFGVPGQFLSMNFGRTKFRVTLLKTDPVIDAQNWGFTFPSIQAIDGSRRYETLMAATKKRQEKTVDVEVTLEKNFEIYIKPH